MALGATGPGVVRLIVGYALRWTLLGVAGGITISLVAARALRTLLFQVPERDPWTLAITSAALIVVALLAAWLPSRRASHIDPIVATETRLRPVPSRQSKSTRGNRAKFSAFLLDLLF
jgi:ABC-type antimicrobial peptide transport system permease subunit